MQTAGITHIMHLDGRTESLMRSAHPIELPKHICDMLLHVHRQPLILANIDVPASVATCHHSAQTAACNTLHIDHVHCRLLAAAGQRRSTICMPVCAHGRVPQVCWHPWLHVRHPVRPQPNCCSVPAGRRARFRSAGGLRIESPGGRHIVGRLLPFSLLMRRTCSFGTLPCSPCSSPVRARGWCCW